MRTHFYKFILVLVAIFSFGVNAAKASLIVYVDVTCKDSSDHAPVGYNSNMYIHYYLPDGDKPSYYVPIQDSNKIVVKGRDVYRVILNKHTDTGYRDNLQWRWHVCRQDPGKEVGHIHLDTLYHKSNYYVVKGWLYNKETKTGGVGHRTPGLVTGGHIYFDNSRTKWTGNIQFVIGHGGQMRTYKLTKVDNTELYYVNLTDELSKQNWGVDHSYYSFIANKTAWKDTLHIAPERVDSSDVGFTENYRRKGELSDGTTYFMRPKYENGQWLFDIYQTVPKYTIYQRAMIRPTGGSYAAVANGVNYPASVNISLIDTIYGSTQETVSKTYNSGTNKNYNPRVLIAGEITHTCTDLKSDAYTFDGWGSSTTGVPTLTGPSNTDIGTPFTHYIAENTTVCAFFTAKSFKVTLNNQSATDPGTESVNPSYGYAMPTIILPTRTGYTFGGYYTEQNGNGTQYYQADGTSAKNYDLTSTLTLYAKWTANTNTPYVVKHYQQNLDGSYPSKPTDTDNLTGTTAASITPSVKSYQGFTAPSKQTTTIAANGSTVVEYKYTRNSYQLTWNLAGGTISKAGTAAGAVKFGATLTAPTVTRTGYTFADWSPSVPTTMPASDTNYTAQWNLITYTVNWMLGEATYHSSTVSVETPLALPTAPANDALGCCANAFVGWSIYAQPTKEQVFNDLASAPTIDGNKTFYAVFATSTLTSGSATATFNEMGYANAEKVTEIALGDGEGNGDATIVFDKDQTGTNYAAYYSASSALHAYAKNTITFNSTSATSTITNVQFTFATKNDGTNAISANVGTYADGIWTGSAESVVFTIGGTTGHRKITSILVTTESVEKYTNYITQCTVSANPVLGNGVITYNSGSAIDVKCGKVSAMNTAATLTFSSAAELTCPVTLTASDGFLISTSKSNDAGYKSSLTISPYKQGSSNAGKLRTIYIRANAEGKTENYGGTIAITGDEITEQSIAVSANVNCQGYAFTLVDHLGNTIGTPASYYAGDIIENAPAAPTADACSKNYTFDGWSTTEVEYGSLVYNKVTFPFVMPAENVTLIPVYRLLEDISKADYHRVTSDLGDNNWAGDYLIAYNDQTFADGSENDLAQIAENNLPTIENNTISAGWGDFYKIAIIPVEGGYVLKTQDNNKPYVYITAEGTSTEKTDNQTTADNHPLTLTYEEPNIKIINQANTKGYSFQYYLSGSCFGFYKSGQPIYLYKKSPLYTSSLICGTMEASDAVVTSTAGQKIKVNVPITLTSSLSGTYDVTAESDNSNFTITNLSGIEAGEHTLSVHYTPTATTDGTETANITLTATNGATTTFQVKGRSLPETFAIVAKVGNMWYALPSQGLNSTTPPTAYPVEVDNIAAPTEVTAVPANADWSLRQVHSSRYEANGHTLVFVNNEGTPKALNASKSATYLLTDAQYANYHNSENVDRYEWTLSTNDLETYTLTNVARSINVSINAATVFGTHSQNVASSELRFLPIAGRYTSLAAQVVEWQENSVVVMYNGNPAQTASTSINGAAAETVTLSEVQKDVAVYALPASNLTDYSRNSLAITIGSEKVILPIPCIVNGAQTDASLCGSSADIAKVSDLVILKGGTLTAVGTKSNPYKFRNVTVYGGGKLVVPADKGFGVNTLTLRIGGVTPEGNYDYVYPEFDLRGTFSNTSGKINLDYVTTKSQYYTFVAPFAVNTKDIKYPVDIYGSNVKADNTGSFEFQYYDGAARANGETGWKVVAEDPTDGATLTAHHGYTFLGMPKKVKVNGGTSTRQTYGIHRIPMAVAAGTAMTHENSEQAVAVSAYPSAKNNNSGWNLIGNPYMVTIGGLTNNDIQVGELVKKLDAGGNWTGGWHWDNPTTGQRFLVFPSNDGQSYQALQASNATLPAFKNFFVQIDSESKVNALSIPRTTPAAQLLAPARRTEEIAQDIELAIVLEQDEVHADQMDFLINEIYSAEFDRNADFTKMMNATQLNLFGVHWDNLSFIAIDQQTAQQSIPIGYQVPDAGEYTLRMSDKPYLMWDKIEALYLTDHEMEPEVTTDIMQQPYLFHVGKAETNHTRFTLSIIRKAESENQTPTHIDTQVAERKWSCKFIYQNKIYILHDGVIYDMMGKQIRTINK